MRTRFALTSAALVLALTTLVASSVLPPGLPIATTIVDFKMPGTQPNQLIDEIPRAQNDCIPCHGTLPDQQPYPRWNASMMGQALRDPIFRAALSIANQDATKSGDLCLRCHTPAGWLGGRSDPTDGSILDPAKADYEGVTCELCHRMVNPDFEPDVSPAIDRRIINASGGPPPTPNSGQYIVDFLDRRRGPRVLDGLHWHGAEWSYYHKLAELCGTCHDVSNPAYTKQGDGSYALNALATQHPTHIKFDEFPIERTFSEWSQSEFARGPVDMNGRFGNVQSVSTCQDCHMPKIAGISCNDGEQHPDVAQHDFNGANSWVLSAVRNLYTDASTGLSQTEVDAAHLRNRQMLERAADMRIFRRGPNQIVVRVVNQTGHKLPTGYPEGRRMWLDVRFYQNGTLLSELGAYDAATGTLNTTNAKVWEAKPGLDAAVAAATGLPAGPSFHFAINNTYYKDNRIPPRGFTNAGFESVQAQPIGQTYEDGQYWDDTAFTLPANTTGVRVQLFHQTTTREYVEFLKNTDTSTQQYGQTAYDQWVANSKSRPIDLATGGGPLANLACPEPIVYGTPKQLSSGRFPRIGSSGSPTLTANNFKITLRSVPPNRLTVLFSSPQMATTPFHGGTLYLATPLTRISSQQTDAQGSVAVPIPITPAMVGTALNYQFLLRDPFATDTIGMTAGLHVDFCQ